MKKRGDVWSLGWMGSAVGGMPTSGGFSVVARACYTRPCVSQVHGPWKGYDSCKVEFVLGMPRSFVDTRTMDESCPPTHRRVVRPEGANSTCIWLCGCYRAGESVYRLASLTSLSRRLKRLADLLATPAEVWRSSAGTCTITNEQQLHQELGLSDSVGQVANFIALSRILSVRSLDPNAMLK